MRIIFLPLLLILSSCIFAQTTSGFENLYPGEESFNLGLGAEGAFRSGNMQFPNSYDSEFMSFSGWAISSTTDTETPGFSNQSSAISGSGHDGSATYAFSYAFNPVRVIAENDAAKGTMDGVYITNSTYSYLSMLNGDQFSKKFGGVDGNDPDFFLVTIEAYFNGELKANQVEFYLADFRFQNNSEDYIVDDWTWVDLKPLGNADSLEFSLSSSDNGAFGMNTPAYFCIDDFVSLDRTTNVDESNVININIFPNPASEYLQLRSRLPMDKVSIYSLSGRIVFSAKINGQKHFKYPVFDLPRGNYIISVQSAQETVNLNWIKQ